MENVYEIYVTQQTYKYSIEIENDVNVITLIDNPCSQNSGPTITNTSELINDGADGIHPFITAEDLPDFSGGSNLGYTASPIDGTVTNDAGTSATLPLANGTNAGLLKPAKYTVLENTSGTNTGDNAPNTNSNAYADSLVEGLNHFKGVYLTEAALISAHPTGVAGDRAQVNEVGATQVVNYSWDAEDDEWVITGSTSGGAANTDELPEGSTNLYFTTARVLATLLTGISFATGGAIVSTDSVLIAFGKIQKQISDIFTLLKNQNYINNTATGSLDLDWSKKVQRFTLTGAVVFTNLNLPTGTDTTVLEVYIKGSYTIDLSAVGTADAGNDIYNGAKWNRFVFSCTNLGMPLNVRYTIQTIES